MVDYHALSIIYSAITANLLPPVWVNPLRHQVLGVPGDLSN